MQESIPRLQALLLLCCPSRFSDNFPTFSDPRATPSCPSSDPPKFYYSKVRTPPPPPTRSDEVRDEVRDDVT